MLHHKTALITGASGGIGLAFAELLARKRFNLVLVARNRKKLEAVKKDIEDRFGVKVRLETADLSRAGAPEKIFKALQKTKTPVEILVNNAGSGDFGPFAESDWKRQSAMIELNIHSLTHLTRLFLPHMIEKGYGRILNIASTAAFQPGPLMAVYYASKAYVLSFSEAIANELRGTGVTATALCPGPTESDFQKSADMTDSKLFKGKKLPTAKAVADYGYRALMRGAPVAIHGLMNAAMAFSVRFAPRRFITSFVRRLQEKS